MNYHFWLGDYEDKKAEEIARKHYWRWLGDEYSVCVHTVIKAAVDEALS